VAKAELGTKRVCPDTGRKFYDLGKTPVISPYTGKIVPIAAPTAARAKPEPATARPTREAEVETVTPETAEAGRELRRCRVNRGRRRRQRRCDRHHRRDHREGRGDLNSSAAAFPAAVTDSELGP